MGTYGCRLCTLSISRYWAIWNRRLYGKVCNKILNDCGLLQTTVVHPKSTQMCGRGGAVLKSMMVRLVNGLCHNHDIPPQPSHTYSCLLAVQTPPEHSLTKPKPISGLPDPSTAFPNPSAAFPKGCCTDVCLVSIPEAVNTIPEHI